MKLSNIISSIVVVIFFISIALNIIQYKRDKEPIIEEVIVRDTITRIDTIKITLKDSIFIKRPTIIRFDTIENITTYRDTIFLAHGWIVSEDNVSGSLLNSTLSYNLSVSEYYKQRIVTNTITRTVRNDLLYAHGGLGYDGKLYPILGGTYIWNNHKNMISINYLISKGLNITYGFNIIK